MIILLSTDAIFNQHRISDCGEQQRPHRLFEADTCIEDSGLALGQEDRAE